MSTVSTVYWVAVATFWSLLVVNIATPGKPPWPLAIIEDLALYALLSAYFYVLGTKRKASTKTYEMSN